MRNTSLMVITPMRSLRWIACRRRRRPARIGSCFATRTAGACRDDIRERDCACARDACAPALGIHCHNDGELAVANTLAAVDMGARQVQGTINGFGERCGNLNLCSLIPNLQFKMGKNCVSRAQLKKLREVSHFFYELANINPNKHQPYVGDSAFAHKGGLHVSGIIKNRETYEHIDPEVVGNRQRVLVSDLAGRSNVIYKAKEYGIDLSGHDQAVHEILRRTKELESQGYEFEAAEASFEL